MDDEMRGGAYAGQGEVGAANRAKSDLLFAIERGVSRGRESDGVTTRELTFYHLLSKVEVAAEGER